MEIAIGGRWTGAKVADRGENGRNEELNGAWPTAGQNRCRINSRNSLLGWRSGEGRGLNRLQLAGWQPLFSNREETCNRSDTGHYRTCPSSFRFPPAAEQKKEIDSNGTSRPSNEEKQSLKPAVRPIGRGNRVLSSIAMPSHAFTPHCEKRLLPVLLAFR